MRESFDEATATARMRRAALLKTIGELRHRASPGQLMEDVLTTLDPKLTVLRRMRRRLSSNKLISLASLAGAGWLAGVSRHLDGKPLAARKAGTAPPRAKPKEKKNDSGQHQRNQRPVPGAGRTGKDARP